MKTFRLRFTLIALILSACSYAAPSPPTATQQAAPPGLPSSAATATPLLLPLPTGTSAQAAVTVTVGPVQPTDTPAPTATPTTGMVIQIVSDGSQPVGPQSQAPACGRPPGWVVYTVQPSDTLSSLAQRTGTSTQQIQNASCLGGTLIFAGQVLYLPYVPAPQAAAGSVQTPVVGDPPPVPGSVRTPKVGLPGDHLISIEPDAGPAGTRFTLRVTEYASSEEVILTIVSSDTKQTVLVQPLYTDEDGNLTWIYQSPVSLAPGDYNVYEDGRQSKAAGKGHFSITSSTSTYP